MMRKLIILLTIACLLSTLAACGKREPSLSQDEYITQGLEFCDSGEYEKAIERFTKAIKADPDTIKAASAYYERARIYLAQGKYDKAVYDCERAIQIEPALRNGELYFLRGVIYEGAGDYDQAASDFSEAIKINPEFAAAYNERGTSLIHIQKFKEARDDYVTAIELSPTGTPGKDALSNLQRLAEAIEDTVEERKEIVVERAQRLFAHGVDYFAEAGKAYGASDVEKAIELERLALSLFSLAHNMAPEDGHITGFVYYTKAVIYNTNGLKYIITVSPQDTPYNAYVKLRKAYFPLAMARPYYDLAYPYLADTPSYKKAIDAHINANNTFLGVVKDVLPKLEPGEKNFMKNIDDYTECIFNFDSINNMISTKQFDAAEKAIDKNRKLIKKIKSDHDQGFLYMCDAYDNLIGILTHPQDAASQTPENLAALKENFTNCISNLNNAESYLQGTVIFNACHNLKEYLIDIRERVQNEYGIAV